MTNSWPKFSDAHFLAILFAAIGSAATVLTAAMPWLQPDTLSRRIKAVSSERERIRARERERLQAAQSKATLRVEAEPASSSNWSKPSISPAGSAPKRPRSNWRWPAFAARARNTPFWRFAWRPPIAFFLVAVDLSVLDPQVESAGDDQGRHRDRRQPISASRRPSSSCSNKTVKRQKELERAFPNTLDLLLICAESGMSIEHAVRKVSQEIGIESVSMAEEMGLLAAEMSYLAERRIAFENLGLEDRTGFDPLADHRPFAVGALRHAARRGAPRA